MESRFDHLMAFVVLTLIVVCKAMLDYNKLFDTIPKGKSKQWTFTLPTGHGIAIEVINVDGKNAKWTIGGFRNSRRKRVEKFDYKSRLPQLVMKFHYDELTPEESVELDAWEASNNGEREWMEILTDFKNGKASTVKYKMPDPKEELAKFRKLVESKKADPHKTK